MNNIYEELVQVLKEDSARGYVGGQKHIKVLQVYVDKRFHVKVPVAVAFEQFSSTVSGGNGYQKENIRTFIKNIKKNRYHVLNTDFLLYQLTDVLNRLGSVSR